MPSSLEDDVVVVRELALEHTPSADLHLTSLPDFCTIDGYVEWSTEMCDPQYTLLYTRYLHHY